MVDAVYNHDIGLTPMLNLRVSLMTFVILPVALSALTWRVLDFLNEALSGAVKMSLGQYCVTDSVAVLMQIIIIGFLGLFLYKAAALMLRVKTKSPVK
jgi:hypothetical protein